MQANKVFSFFIVLYFLVAEKAQTVVEIKGQPVLNNGKPS